MSKPNDGGKAFPHIYFEEGRDGHGLHYTDPANPGMTIRQYYKAKIIHAVYAEKIRYDVADYTKIAEEVGRIADALIAEDEEFEKRGSE